MVASESNTNRKRGLRKALQSIARYPLPIASPAATVRLEGIGSKTADTIAARYNDLLVDYGPDGILSGAYNPDAAASAASASSAGSASSAKRKRSSSTAAGSATSGSKKKKKQKQKAASSSGGNGYTPRKGSGAWALLVGLYRWQVQSDPETWLGPATKEEVINVAQPLTESLFTVPEDGGGGGGGGGGRRRGRAFGGPTFTYTAWSNMKRLLTEAYVIRTGRPFRYQLTETGIAAGRRALGLAPAAPSSVSSAAATATAAAPPPSKKRGKTSRGSASSGLVTPAVARARSALDEVQLISPITAVPPSKATSSRYYSAMPVGSPAWVSSIASPRRAVSAADIDLRAMLGRAHPSAGRFDLKLVVDKRETNSGKLASRKLEKALKSCDFPIEFRACSVGDFMFVLTDSSDPSRELVADFIVERKTLEDLCGSIRSGRYRHQLARLINSGIKRAFFLLEGDMYAKSPITSDPAVAKTQQSLATAVHRIKAFGLYVHTAESSADSAAWLESVYRFLLASLHSNGLDAVVARDPDATDVPLTFDRLQKIGAITYNESVTSIFARQLLAISGMSPGKAAAVLLRFRTLAALRAHYRSLDPEQGKALFAADKVPGSNRAFGQELSQTIWSVIHRQTQT